MTRDFGGTMGSTGFKHNSVPTLFFAAFGQVLLDICVLCRPFGPILHLILGSPKFSLRKKMLLRFTLYRKVHRTPSHGLERFVSSLLYTICPTKCPILHLLNFYCQLWPLLVPPCLQVFAFMTAIGLEWYSMWLFGLTPFN